MIYFLIRNFLNAFQKLGCAICNRANVPDAPLLLIADKLLDRVIDRKVNAEGYIGIVKNVAGILLGLGNRTQSACLMLGFNFKCLPVSSGYVRGEDMTGSTADTARYNFNELCGGRYQCCNVLGDHIQFIFLNSCLKTASDQAV